MQCVATACKLSIKEKNFYEVNIRMTDEYFENRKILLKINLVSGQNIPPHSQEL